MPRPSPQTERLVEVIELLAADGKAGRTLAEIARHLGVDKATCYPMLSELTHVGWLVRHPRAKSYHLGPRLVPIGQAAENAFDVVELAKPRLVSLAQQLKATCLLFGRSERDLVVADTAFGSAASRRARRDSAIGLRVGDTIAWKPPLGSVLVAWSGDDVTADWLDFAPDSDTRAHLVAALDAVRSRGFAIEEFRPNPHSLGELISDAAGELRGSRRADQLMRDQLSRLDGSVLIADVRPGRHYFPISINAPVFSADGEVTHAVCVADLDVPMDGETVTSIGKLVAEVAAQISYDTGAR